MPVNTGGHRLNRNPHGGFTFVEVLVATGFVAVSLLGGAVALLEAIRAQRDAQFRTLAALLLSDLAERITANPAAGPAYALAPDDVPAPPDEACTLPTSCGPDDTALDDLHDWYSAVTNALPLATASVEVTPDSPPGTFRYAIRVGWSDTSGAGPEALDRAVHR